MKLYSSPGASAPCPPTSRSWKPACPISWSRSISGPRKLENGENYLKLNPKGLVPALGLGGGEIVTEGPVIVQMIADQASTTAPSATSCSNG